MSTHSAVPTPRRPQILGAFLVALIAFAFAFTPLRASTDEWWHLKTGRYIAGHGLPPTDIYTYTARDFPWYNHEWLSQIAMWRVFQAGDATGFGGLRALILVKTLFVLLTFVGFGWLLARRMKAPLWGWCVAALALMLARRHFYPRPPFISYLLMALVFWMLIEWRAGRLRAGWLWLLAPLFALWANLHGGWAAGVIFIAAFWADAAWSVAGDWALGADARPAARRLGGLTALGLACAASTLVNPYGWHLTHVGNVMSDPYLKRIISELKPPQWRFVLVIEGTIYLILAAALRPRSPRGWAGALLLGAGLHFTFHCRLYWDFLLPQQSPHPDLWEPNPWLATAVAVAAWAALLVRLRPAGWPAHVLLGAFFLQQGILHVRHLPLTALALMPGLCWGLDAWLARPAGRPRTWLPATLLALGALILIFLPLPTIHAAPDVGDYFRHKSRNRTGAERAALPQHRGRSGRVRARGGRLPRQCRPAAAAL